MNEKTMVADTLAGINGELVRYGEMIPQTENPELKQTLKQIRNQCEMSQKGNQRRSRTCPFCVKSGLTACVKRLPQKDLRELFLHIL